MKKWLLRASFGAAGVIALAVASLTLMGLRDTAGLSTSSIEIDATPETVWPWIDQPDKFKQWVSWVVSVESPNPDVKGVGRKSIVLMKEPSSPEPVRIETVLTDYAPPMRLSADVKFPGLFTGSQTYQLKGLEGGRTRVQLDSRIHYTTWIIRLFEPLGTPSATKKLDQDFAALKRLIEKTSTTAAN